MDRSFPEGNGFTVHRLQTLLPMPEGVGLAVCSWQPFPPLSEDEGFPVCRWQMLPHLSEDICFVICRFDCRIHPRPKTMISPTVGDECFHHCPKALVCSSVRRIWLLLSEDISFLIRRPRMLLSSPEDEGLFIHCCLQWNP